DVARLHAGLLRRTVRRDVADEGALGLLQPQALREVLGDLLDLDTEPAAHDLALLADLGHDLLGDVDGHGEADAGGLRDALGHDPRVDADDLAAGVDERPTGVARVDGGVRLDHVDRSPWRAEGQRPTLVRDDPDRDAVASQAEWVSDGHHPLADVR